MLGVLTGLAAEARLLPRGVLLQVGGGSRAPDGNVVRALLNRGATALVSVGVCGGLDPALAVGAVVIPDAVLFHGTRLHSDPALSARFGRPAGVMLAAERPLATREAKASAFANGACAVDLETGVLARVAEQAGVPWAAMRVVCDPAWRDLPRAAAVALDDFGRVRPWAVLRALTPAQVPALLRVGVDAARARRALAQAVRRAAWF